MEIWRRDMVVSNSLMSSQTTINLTTNDPRVVCSVPIGISQDTDLDKARTLLLDLRGKHPKATQVCGCPRTLLSASGVVLSLDIESVGLVSLCIEGAKKLIASAERHNFNPHCFLITGHFTERFPSSKVCGALELSTR